MIIEYYRAYSLIDLWHGTHHFFARYRQYMENIGLMHKCKKKNALEIY